MNKPLVSIIMSVYNEQQYVAGAIQSILDQTHSNFELLIIDDYSTDDSLRICRGFDDPRIRIYAKTVEPRHLASSRNIGIQMARGDYIAFQDADDTCHRRRIEIQLQKAMESPDSRVVGCSLVRIENGEEKIVTYPQDHRDICAGFRKLFNRTTICSGTILASKQIFQSFNYRLRFAYMQDWDLTLRMYESGQIEFYNCPEPLYRYYIRPKGVLGNPKWLDYNIYVRNCQSRRKHGRKEYATLEDFLQSLRTDVMAGIYWVGLKKLIELKRRIGQFSFRLGPVSWR